MCRHLFKGAFLKINFFWPSGRCPQCNGRGRTTKKKQFKVSKSAPPGLALASLFVSHFFQFFGHPSQTKRCFCTFGSKNKYFEVFWGLHVDLTPKNAFERLTLIYKLSLKCKRVRLALFLIKHKTWPIFVKNQLRLLTLNLSLKFISKCHCITICNFRWKYSR